MKCNLSFDVARHQIHEQKDTRLMMMSKSVLEYLFHDDDNNNYNTNTTTSNDEWKETSSPSYHIIIIIILLCRVIHFPIFIYIALQSTIIFGTPQSFLINNTSPTRNKIQDELLQKQQQKQPQSSTSNNNKILVAS